jgi:bifunctional DNA-binding transcriptional regulator/antitoxin component of YhaV-PrlF toxin-antitoxin module
MNLKLTILNLDVRGKNPDMIGVLKSGMTIPISYANRLGIKKGDYVLIARLNQSIFIAKRPSGLFGGHRASASGGNKLSVQFNPVKLKIPTGTYSLLDDEIPQEIEDLNGKKHSATFYQIKLIE